jgi:diamine N-acetyltransferase
MAGAPAPTPPLPFRADHYQLADTGLWLSAVTTDEAIALGEALATIDPWARYGTSGSNLTALFVPNADGGIRLAVRARASGAPIGVMAIRHPWLTGPYMQFLAILPDAQGGGHGTALLGWFEAQARVAGARNLWICAAAFNTGARRLYLRFGFEQVVVFDDLIKPGVDEVLMRKRLL